MFLKAMDEKVNGFLAFTCNDLLISCLVRENPGNWTWTVNASPSHELVANCKT